jgi:hypothetical protein
MDGIHEILQELLIEEQQYFVTITQFTFSSLIKKIGLNHLEIFYTGLQT